MIETIVLNYLLEKLNVPVYAEKPEEPPEQFVIIEKIGTSEKEKLESALFAIKSHADSLCEAAELNKKVKDAMKDIDDLDSISKVVKNTDYNFTDTDTKKHRYQAVYELFHY